MNARVRYQVLIQSHPDEIRARQMSCVDLVNELFSLRAMQEISDINHHYAESDTVVELEFVAREPNKENFLTRVTVYGSERALHDLVHTLQAAPA